MNQQRQQAYLNLIHSLLNCRDGEKAEILDANRELIDTGLLQILQWLKAMFLQQGDQNTANRLQGLTNDIMGNCASYLREVLRLGLDTKVDLPSLREEEKQSYFQFFSEVIQATAAGMGNPQLVYPLLANNVNKLDEVLVKILRQWGINTLKEARGYQAEYLAGVIVIFSTLIAQFPLGNKANNVEITIAGCEVALTVYTQQAFPRDWAVAHSNLANAYSIRIRGERADNLEQAIAYLQEALKVLTFGAFPQDWAKAQNSLGNAYSDRIRGDKADNLEQAIAYSQEALKVLTFETFPYEWAMTQNNLATAYRDRIRGKQADNLEQAIACFQEILKVFTFETFPQEWARTQNNLGAAYSKRIRGDKADNLEQAIAYYQQTLKVYTFETFPQEWARTQYNLGSTYSDRIRGNRAQNLEQAIAYHQEALRVRTFDAFPQNWANIQNALANAYCDRITGDKANNLEQAIAYYQQALKVFTFDAFPQNWANTQNSLATAYIQRIRGERAQNLEEAIAYCQEAMNVYTFEAFPQDWAMTQNNLGTAYLHRIRRDKADNLEEAIAYCQEAMKVFTFEAFPEKWANTQNNLGLAYFQRIRGDKADNLELAIAYLQESLKIYTSDTFPYERARTQNNLGLAYLQKIRGDKANNLEQTIFCLQESLKIYTFEAFPHEWANTQSNLAITYRNRIRGDKAGNLEQAISYLRKAMQVYTFEAFPEQWAITQTNVANAYSDRIIGERAQNLEWAIAYYQESLKVYTIDTFPQDWAQTQNNIGIAYCKRIKGDKFENLKWAIVCYQESLRIYTIDAFPYEWARTQSNLANAYTNIMRWENAIACLQEALKVYTFEAFPHEWARTKNNLGIAYNLSFISGQTDNLEQAITCHQNALKVYTSDTFPYEWANTQFNLGHVYSNVIGREKSDGLEQAIICFQESLTVRTFEAVPQNHVESLWGLGIAYQKMSRYTLAYNTFASAISTVESLREEAVSGEEGKRKQAEYFNEIYSRMIEVCLELDNITEAIEYVERSKTRNLVELILERDSKTIFPTEKVTKLEKYRDEIATGQYQIQNGKAENPQVLAQHLNQLRQQRNELQNQYLSVGYDFKFDSFQTTLDEGTAIIEWYILKNKILAFIVKATGDITVWQSQPEDREALKNWLDKYLQEYNNQKDKWKDSLEEELKTLASILHIDEILTLIPKDCEQLILIPHTFLHLLPLHALPVGENHQDSHCLLDLFTGGISCAPSCQLLQQVQKRERPNFSSIFAIKDPTKNLAYTKLEVDSILNLFSSHQVLSGNEASKNALLREMPKLKQANYLHFSCHGSFNLNSPQDSCLLLAESEDDNNDLDLSKCLTLGNLFEQDFRLDNCRLVVLSACETGLVDSNNTSDEYISLPSGFLYAGSTSVVSSLWTVSDLSTAFMMIKFLQNLQTAMINGEDFSVAVSLNQAQKWLRNSTKTQLEEWIGEHKLNSVPALRIQLRRRFHNISNDSRPFQSPFYWAAFCGVGI